MKQQIEITNPHPNINSGVSARTGNEYKIVTQEGYIHTAGKKYPELVAWPIEDETKALKEGFYEVDDSDLLTTGSFHSLDYKRFPDLVPVKQQAKQQHQG